MPLSSAMVFDLVDVGREYLPIAPCMDAYDALKAANTTAKIAAANASMAAMMSEIDRLLGASEGSLLGEWIGAARKMAANVSTNKAPSGHGRAVASTAADFLEWNARAQVTSWSPSLACDGQATSISPLYDYGNKAWNGLVKGYYDKRYMIFAESKRCQLQPTDPACKSFSYNGELMKLACQFQHDTTAQPSVAVGDAISISEELWSKY